MAADSGYRGTLGSEYGAGGAGYRCWSDIENDPLSSRPVRLSAVASRTARPLGNHRAFPPRERNEGVLAGSLPWSSAVRLFPAKSAARGGGWAA